MITLNLQSFSFLHDPHYNILAVTLKEYKMNFQWTERGQNVRNEGRVHR